MSPTQNAIETANDGPDGRILVLYYAQKAPLRASIADQLYCFERYAGRECIYINLAVRRIPAWVSRLDIRLVVFSTLLLSQRWDRRTFRRAISRLQPVKQLKCPKIAIPQDEYIHTEAVSEFVREFDVDWVLSNAPDAEWEVIYGDLAHSKVRFRQVLTGYLEPQTVSRIDELARGRQRTIDIGYRAYDPEFSLGRHAQLKAAIAPVVTRAAREAGMTADISVRAEDTLLGDAWYRFLLQCRWVVGVEGGAGLLDRDGTLLDCSRAYQKAHPHASFEEVEAACFPGMDGNLRLFAISPRHLEACATMTAQALVEGSYNGILEAGTHYIAIRPDFSNVSDVLAAMQDEGLRYDIAQNARRDIVDSGRYTYPSFVRWALEPFVTERSVRASPIGRALARWDATLDGPSWWMVRLGTAWRRRARALLDRVGLLDAALAIRERVSRAA